MRTTLFTALVTLASLTSSAQAEIECEPVAGQPTIQFGFLGIPERIVGAPGTVVELDVWASLHILKRVNDRSLQGWSFSIWVRGARVVEVAIDEEVRAPSSFQPTDALPSLFHVFQEGADPDDSTRRGVVGAMAGPRYNQGDSINPIEESAVLRIRLEVIIPADGSDELVELIYTDGFKGSGQPTRNLFTHDGAAGCPETDNASFLATSRSVPFLRGDTNEDGRRDVSDAAVVLNYLFRGSVDTECADAFDTNDDGVLELTDAVSLFNWLFRGGPPPASPFEECGDDPVDDEFSCWSHAVCS